MFRAVARSAIGAAVLAVLMPNAAYASTETFSYDYGLSGSSTQTMFGERAPDGGCIWPTPLLNVDEADPDPALAEASSTSSPAPKNIEARQVWANYDNCAVGFEIGTPPGSQKEPADLEQAGETPCKGGKPCPTASTTSSTTAYQTRGIYYQVTWYDYFGVRVNRVRSYLAWNFDGVHCIQGSTGSTGTWWLTSTSWFRTALSYWKDAGCLNHYWYTDATFTNYAFCGGSIVRVYYDDVRARAGYRGDYGGWLRGTWTTGGCVGLPLHFSTRLVRQY